MKASNAASASLLVSAIQISCNARLAFGCWLFGSLLRTLAVLCTQQRCSRAVGDGEFGRDRQTSVLQIEQQFTPILRALARAVGKAEQLLPALRRRADDDQDALLGVFKTGLQVNAVGPHIDVVLGRQIALPPVLVLVDPDLLQPSNSRGRQARCILAEQGRKRLLEIAGRDALKVKDRDQHLQAPRAPRIGRQDRGCEADAPGIIGSATVAHAGLAHADRADAGHHLAFRQVPVPDPRLRPVAVFRSTCLARNSATSASIAWASRARAPLRSTSVSGSANDPG